jgi:uncharacterized protein YdeI (YjbR/CyaY-like superfamily)
MSIPIRFSAEYSTFVLVLNKNRIESKEMTNPLVDSYFTDGCGRCSLGGTPDCKVHQWADIMRYLRRLLLDCGMDEERKWGVACYTYQKRNILVLGVTKDACSLGFFKGSLMSNSNGLLIAPGAHSQATRQLKFTDLKEAVSKEDIIKTHVFEAIEIEKAGLKVDFKKVDEIALPAELLAVFAHDSALEAAFKSLTPGRQRGYILHFQQPKQESTRYSRIEKARPNILQGKGMNDDYKARTKG